MTEGTAKKIKVNIPELLKTRKEVRRMNDFLKPLNPGETMNIGTPDHLTQIQHKITQIDIVDHFDHGPSPIDAHVVTTILPNGTIKSNY